MIELLDKINEVLWEKFKERVLVTDRDFESIFRQSLSYFNYEINTLDLGPTKEGKFKTAYIWDKSQSITPFKIILNRTKSSFNNRSHFSYTSCSIEDIEIKGCINKTYEDLVNESKETLIKKTEEQNVLKERLTKQFEATLSLYNMELGVYNDLKKLEKVINEM